MRRNKSVLFLPVLITTFLMLANILAGCNSAPLSIASSPQAGRSLLLATTTSTENSGLLTFILPDFERKYGITVKVVAVGTGQALKLGEDGNADLVLVHARDKEDEFIAKGYGVNRKDIMYNDFVIVGPKSDPAGISGTGDAAAALARIAHSRYPFVSRGDESGTHLLEQKLWRRAGINPSGEWYISSGQGMGPVLTMANERLAYTLTDRATYLVMKKQGLELNILVEGDDTLFNPYGIIAVNPERYPTIRYREAMQFIEWITSLEVQEKIRTFGKADFGQSLFFPNSEQWRAAHK